jgi:hypothetical protein
MSGSLLRPGWAKPIAPGADADFCVLRDGVVTHTVVAGSLIFSA